MPQRTDLNREEIRHSVVLLVDACRKLKETAVVSAADAGKVVVDKQRYERVARVVEELAEIQPD